MPCQEGSACEFRTVICANCNWVASKYCSLLQKPCDILARDAKVHSNINALVAEVIGNSEAFDSSSIRQIVKHKIHAPNIIDLSCNLEWHTIVCWALNFLTAAHRQVGILV